MLGFAREFVPKHDENLMTNEGDTASARRRFLADRPTNLIELLRGRYDWMNSYVDGINVYELGSGAGFSRYFIKSKNLVLTDVIKNEWIDLKVDALKMPFESNTVDILICSHMIHHVARPAEFFEEASRVLRIGGKLIIVDINTSYIMRLLLWLMKHEGWSYNVDVFDRNSVVNDPSDPWSANCAVPELLFRDGRKFEAYFPYFKLLRNKAFECFLFPLSGGVIARSPTVELPVWMLRIIERVDVLLVRLLPSVFAMGRQVVLEKK